MAFDAVGLKWILFVYEWDVMSSIVVVVFKFSSQPVLHDCYIL